VKLVAGGKAQYNLVTTAMGYASSSAGPLHFGLGAERKAELVEVTWPSGAKQVVKDLAAGRVHEVAEPE
jgi:hypothetical protein